MLRCKVCELVSRHRLRPFGEITGAFFGRGRLRALRRFLVKCICCGARGGNSKASQKVREWVKLFRKTRWNSTRRAKDYLVDFFIAEHFIDNMRPSFLIYLYSILPSRMTMATNASSGVNTSRPSRHVAQHATAAAS